MSTVPGMSLLHKALMNRYLLTICFVLVVVKHSGKKYNVDLDLEESGLTFKMQLYSLTGVPPERQKILTKVSHNCKFLTTDIN